MTQTWFQAKLESGINKVKSLPRRPIVAGALGGITSGVMLGVFTGPAGTVLGMWMGVGVGLVTGYVLAEEHQSRSIRTGELDAIIGITKGSMGAGTGISAPPPPLDAAEDEEEMPQYSTKEAWLKEWLTPPPPTVG
jgi:hypothetical protein